MLQIPTHRLHSERLINSHLTTPTEVVAWLGAVQSQDYMGAKWAVAQRTIGLNDADVEQAFNEGSILRTHILRPTWHFVTPADIRWMLRLSAPRVHQLNGTYYRKCGLDADLLSRSNAILTDALKDHNYCTREALAERLQAAGIALDGLRLVYIMMQAELDQLICSGPRKGKQFTYALMDERAPSMPDLSTDEALGGLAYRYFASHGPATIKDYVWWSGLTLAQAKAGLNLSGSRLNHEEMNGQTYYFAGDIPTADFPTPTAHLLPNYDEAMGSYANYSAVTEAQFADMWDGKHGVLAHYVVIDGRIVGSWQRTFKKDIVTIKIKPFIVLSDTQMKSVELAAGRFGDFLGLSVVLDWLPPATIS
jgi:hypothetical protein